MLDGLFALNCLGIVTISLLYGTVSLLLGFSITDGEANLVLESYFEWFLIGVEFFPREMSLSGDCDWFRLYSVYFFGTVVSFVLPI